MWRECREKGLNVGRMERKGVKYGENAEKKLNVGRMQIKGVKCG